MPQVPPDQRPFEQVGGGEEGGAPFAADNRNQNEPVEIALVVGHDHQWALGGDSLGRHDLQPKGASEDRSNGQRGGRVRREPRLVTIESIACGQNPKGQHV